MFALVVGMLVIAEGAVRVRQYVKYGVTADFNEFYMTDEKTGLRVLVAGKSTQRISINSLGFRGPEINREKPPGTFRLAFLGASTTYCAEVSSNDKVWVDLVARDLSEQFDRVKVDYINGSVPGYALESSLKNLSLRIAPLEPDLVVIYHATNDLSDEMRGLAEAQGVTALNLEKGQSWLADYSLLWKLVEMNLSILVAEERAEQQSQTVEFVASKLGTPFKTELAELVRQARTAGAKRVALATFSIQLRNGQNEQQLRKASESATYYMPFTSPQMLIEAYARYNDVIREVARESGALLIDDESMIPGDPTHFHDTVHFTDTGSAVQAQRVSTALAADEKVRKMLQHAGG